MEDWYGGVKEIVPETELPETIQKWLWGWQYDQMKDALGL
jgi:hypothetical protein